MKNKLITLIALSLSFSVTAFADQSLKLKGKEGVIEFLAKGPLVRVQGKGEGPSGNLSIVDGKASGTLSLNLKTLDTGISLRDDHMKNKYLQVEQHPVAKLALKDVVLPKKFKGKAKFTGLLTLHGVTKKVSGNVNIKGVKNGATKITADFKIQFSDFKIELPSFKLVSVGEEIKIQLKTKASVTDTEKPASL